MLAKIVNDDAGNLDDRRAWAFFASKLAPTVIDGAVSASTSSTEKPLSQASQLPQGDRVQNTDHPIRSLNNSNAFIPASELPAAFSSGDHTHTVNCPGTTATIPPPTPLLPGRPTR